MKNVLLNLARLIIISISGVVVIYAASSSRKELAMLFAGLFFKSYFTRGMYDPLFGDSTAQEWLLNLLRRKKKPKLRANLPKWDV